MTELKVVDFKRDEATEHHQLEVIRLLEEGLELAKSNKSVSMAIVMINNDASVTSCYHFGNRPFVMVGALDVLKTNFIKDCIEGCADG